MDIWQYDPVAEAKYQRREDIIRRGLFIALVIMIIISAIYSPRPTAAKPSNSTATPCG